MARTRRSLPTIVTRHPASVWIHSHDAAEGKYSLNFASPAKAGAHGAVDPGFRRESEEGASDESSEWL
jgi:hypothetical protein